MLVSKIALILFLGSVGLQFVLVIAIIQGMGPMPRDYDSEWASRMFQGRNGKLLAVAACNFFIACIAMVVFAVTSQT